MQRHELLAIMGELELGDFGGHFGETVLEEPRLLRAGPGDPSAICCRPVAGDARRDGTRPPVSQICARVGSCPPSGSAAEGLSGLRMTGARGVIIC